MIDKGIYNLFIVVFIQWMKWIIFTIAFIGLSIIQVLTSSIVHIPFFIISILGTYTLIIAILYSDWKFHKEYKKLKQELKEKENE